jgi:hypothetical protein
MARVDATANLLKSKEALMAASASPVEEETLRYEIVALRHLYRRRLAKWDKEMTLAAQAAHRRWKAKLNNDQMTVMQQRPFPDADMTFTVPDITEEDASFSLQVEPHQYRASDI